MTSKKTAGRPRIKNPANQTLGRVRVTQDQIDEYTQAATIRDESLSDFVRDTMDKASKRVIKNSE